MTTLLDANVLVALSSPDHVHHASARDWFGRLDGPFATCIVTQLALVRVLISVGAPPAVASAALAATVSHERHEFWPDRSPVDPTVMLQVIGHRQVTDAYLVDLASRRGGLLATFDRGLHATHHAATELVPT